jgi:branched-chain amino acid transport system ATP-binding protein
MAVPIPGSQLVIATRGGGKLLLSVSGLSLRFAGLQALDRVDLRVEAGQILGLIGPNGAGKSTLINCLTRLYTPQAGTVDFGGVDVLKLRPHQVVKAGITRTFQGLELYPGMTVRETLLVGQHTRFATSTFAVAMGWPTVRTEELELGLRTAEILDIFHLTQHVDRLVGTLPYGVQKRIDLARALAAGPKLILLDEPAAGLNAGEVAVLEELILDVRRRFNLSILLVEHHVGLVRQVADNVCVLNFGRRIAFGPPDEVYLEPAVIEAYLGTPEEDDDDA